MQSVVYHTGPILYHAIVEEADITKLETICKKEKRLDYTNKLAGHLKEEYFVRPRYFEDIMNPYFTDFNENANSFYNTSRDIYCNSSWVNYMKAGEYNPVHAHTNCDFSGVLFLSMPDEIKKENEAFVGTGDRYCGPGNLSFITGPVLKAQICERSFFPRKGDLFIFPGTLLHFVAPFKSNVERVSMAFNIKYR